MSKQGDALRKLYPPLASEFSDYLDVGDGHQLYYEVSGNPDGRPVVFLHGGPGGGTSPVQRRFFDPKRYRIILFDQRGCGRSKPFASLDANTSHHLVADMERLRRHLKIDRWHVFGGSWGSTLALLYAQSYPERVTALVLRGIFLMRQRELDWFYKSGTNALFPSEWQDFLAPIPLEERGDIIEAYYRRLTGPNEAERIQAAKAWSRWESSCVTLVPDEQQIRQSDNAQFALAFARIECHYFKHRGFLEHDDQILRHADRLRQIPTILVQGRYDAICPPISAWELKRALPDATLRLVPVAGHSAFEPAIVHELVTATDRLA
ncbi:proline iminopeptidase [Iodidimonas muriae]|uniref:Proline iminopeptidase n=1 Tax=Iodidimonas muriae TaxID=261467 RepID=A0ABQ2LD22_9PROT|nr:prolyl aminopeptidase [Iodidimonas muriae]GER07323.1 proline iminopeptidase [Kordiimonadales bacterium JCM 17843]GGO10970.1 proline iminopeptidase [Iodidimonas muriae]